MNLFFGSVVEENIALATFYCTLLFFYCTLGLTLKYFSSLFQDGIPVISVNNKSLVTKYQVLEGKMRKLEESIECCICTTRKKNVVFLCGHGSCQYCADQLKTCHICQTEITRKIQIF